MRPLRQIRRTHFLSPHNHPRLPSPPVNDLTEQEAQLVAEHQNSLLFAAERFFDRGRIPKAIRRAFLKTPRHQFAPRFYSSQRRSWIDLADAPIREHLAELYGDHPLCIFKDELGRSLSTVSQPSLVLYMIDLLDLKAGHSVFELGGGSGWNAALMGRIVGETGSVNSIEIIESLVEDAQTSLKALGLKQVAFSSGDASLGTETQEQFDRGIFTASAWSLPNCFFQQIKSDGLLLFVLKAQPNYDLLCLLKKTDSDTFSSELHFTCSFVPVTGSSKLPEHSPLSLAKTELTLSSELSWADIKIQDTSISPFIEFVKLVFDCQQTYLIPSQELEFDEEFWGIHNPEQSSLIIYNEDRIQLFGDDSSLILLRRAAKRWQKAGQPELDQLKLSFHAPSNTPAPNNDQWIVKRGDCTLLWGL